jgi:SAM-dependent methyltransferase
MLTITNPLREQVVLSVIRRLQLPLGSRGLDAGCGIGLQTLQLARAVGSWGHVTGLDKAADLLAYAHTLVLKSGMSERISLREGDIGRLPYDNNAFDWAWSADCVGYAPVKPLPLLKELVRVVRPGGLVVILAWSSERLLPGYPLLEAHLNATSSGIAPFVQGTGPDRHFLRALGWFKKVGLEGPLAQTFVGDVSAPLSMDLRDALIALFQMRWSGAESELLPAYRSEYRRLCLPESADFIVDLSDYYAFFTYTVFSATVSDEAR